VSISFGQARRSGEYAHWDVLAGRERLDDGGDRVALTFDDGPDSDATPAVLDALDAAGLKATFFLVGEQVMDHRALAREVAERGHEIGLHGFEHIRHSDQPDYVVRDDLARALGAIEVGAGRRPRFFRPPYGGSSEASLEAAKELELQLVYWSAWGMDWQTSPVEQMVELVTPDLTPGAILLLHDSARYTDQRHSAEATAVALPLIAAAASERGLRLTPLGQG
jgi:peptidoglycan/xylan/chitin deacetylase (PgdA/CDA1 family)